MSYAYLGGWEGIRASFKNQLEGLSSHRLLSAWSSSAARTSLYAEVIPRVAKSLGMRARPEFLNIDYALEDPHGQMRVVIESENDFWRVSNQGEELEKLCSCRAETGLLLTVAQWDEKPGPPWHSQRREYLPKWLACVAGRMGRAAANQLVVAGVAELLDRRLRIYEEILSGPHRTAPTDAPTVIYERHLEVGAA